jgi:pSer/pThr/pTyr-binding forkhead associated (FHA) protein
VSFPRALLSLTIRGETLVRGEDDGEFVIGRSQACDLVIAESCVSREHASIVVRRGRVILTDTSSTGTYVVGQSDRPLFVRRESLHLIGAGTLSLGRTPNDNPNLIGFRQTIEG